MLHYCYQIWVCKEKQRLELVRRSEMLGRQVSHRLMVWHSWVVLVVMESVQDLESGFRLEEASKRKLVADRLNRM